MSLDLAVDHLLAAKRITGTKQSYAADNPAESLSVFSYLDGGPRPSGVKSELGLGLLELEDERRGPAPPPAVHVPEPIAGLGYSLVYEDDFDELNTDEWRLGYEKVPESPANYAHSGSVVRITNRPAERKQRDLQTRRTWTGGYFSARMRYSRDTSAWASHWSMSEAWLRRDDGSLGVAEFDIFEAFQSEPGSTWRSHSGTLHRNTSSQPKYPLPDEFRPNWTQDCGFELGENWRDYGGLITPTEAATFVDGKQQKRWPVYATTWQPLLFMVGIWSHGYVREVWCEVDRFEVWQK